MGGHQNCRPLLGPLNTRCRIVIGPKRDHSFDNHPYQLQKPCLISTQNQGAQIDPKTKAPGGQQISLMADNNGLEAPGSEP